MAPAGGPLKPGFGLSGDVPCHRHVPPEKLRFVLTPWELTRLQQSGQSHFVAFCCYRRRCLLTTDASCRIFEAALERVRPTYGLYVYGYVVMPEHVHLLLSEPLADALKSLKQGLSAIDWGREAFLAKSDITTSTFEITGSLWRSCDIFIEIRSSGLVRAAGGLGAEQFSPLPPAVRDASRSSRNGRHENANEWRTDFVQL